MTDIDPNYMYWREHGAVWNAEYEFRKHILPLYHIQELMLAEYIAAHANLTSPTRVLEFGCGVGRHLRNLVRIPGIDVHGFDQSETMIAGCHAWADSQWLTSHVNHGDPVGTLPFPDESFDIVYSTEVLVHVRPEHLVQVLKELLRVARGHILHLEPAPGARIHSNVHSGCWFHDLQNAYDSLGFRCIVSSGGYGAHAPYQIVKGAQPVYFWESWRLEMYRTCERMLTEGIDAARADKSSAEDLATIVRSERDAARSELAATLPRITELTERCVRVQSELDSIVEELEKTKARANEDLQRAKLEANLALDQARQHERAAVERTRMEVEAEQARRFEPLLCDARKRIEAADSAHAALRREIAADALMRENLSVNSMAQRFKIAELSDTLRKLKLQYEHLTASVRRLVDGNE